MNRAGGGPGAALPGRATPTGLAGQGRRILWGLGRGGRGEAGEERGEVVLVEGGGEALGGDAPGAGGVAAQQVEGEVAQGGEVPGGVAGADPAGVLAAGHVEDPVQPVLDAPVAADEPAEGGRAERGAQ